jgi:hypothetical protein
MGIAPVAYTLFAFCVGAAAGVVLKKVVPAMVAAIVLYVPPRIIMARSVRATVITPETVSFPAGTSSPRTGLGDWILSNNLVDAAGHPIGINYQTLSAACQKTMGPSCFPAGARYVDNYRRWHASGRSSSSRPESSSDSVRCAWPSPSGGRYAACPERPTHQHYDDRKLTATAEAQAAGRIRAGDPFDIMAMVIAMSMTWSPVSNVYAASDQMPSSAGAAPVTTEIGQ